MTVEAADNAGFAGMIRRRAGELKDLAVTLLLWAYFTLGFVLLFFPFYLFAFFFSKDRTASFQRLNSRFYRGFFFLCRFLIPRHKWDISPEVRDIRASIVVSNHLSYLDSIFLISLFPRHTTIAKAGLFGIPIFGRMLASSGYIPSSGDGPYAELLLNSLETIRSLLASGGNIVVFPEGTRSRDGQIGSLHGGVFKIARYCKAPIEVIGIRNTEKLFEPGRFLFSTRRFNTIRVRRIAGLTPDYEEKNFSKKELTAEVARLLAEHAAMEPM